LFLIYPYKGLSMKEVRTQRGGSSSDVDVRIFWCKKFRIFRNAWCVRTDTEMEGIEPARTFCGQGGQFFPIWIGRLL